MTYTKSQLLLVTIAVISWLTRSSESCPTNCQCTRFPNVVNCQSIRSLVTFGMEPFPTDTVTLIIRNGLFNKLSDIDLMQIPAKDLRTLEITSSQLAEIYDNAFTSLVSLRVLKLNKNQLRTIQVNSFKGLQNLQTLDLSNNQLTFLPSAEVLNPLTYLKSLDFSNNGLKTFPNGLFHSQTRLQELNIANNNIENLKGTFFQGARDLRKFLASKCRIRTLEKDFFTAITNVDTLDLSYNQIDSLPDSSTLSVLRHLGNFTLKGNRISHLVDDQFPGLNLNVLDLSNNAMSTVSPNSFKYLTGLRNLDMSFNQLGTLPSYLFQPIASGMYSLQLNNNPQLSKLPDRIFDNMDKLNELNLSFCSLTRFSDDHFQPLNSLKNVDISNNKLQSVPQSFLDKTVTNSMLLVRLDNNQWHCDCEIKPFRNWLQLSHTASQLYCQHNTNTGFRMNCPMPRCYSPSNFMNRDIVLLTDRDVGECENFAALTSPETSIILGVVLGVVGVIIVIILTVVIAICLYRRHKRGDPLLCGEKQEYVKPPHRKQGREKTTAHKRNSKKDQHFSEQKERRKNADPEIGSLNESDKSFVVRNYFRSMTPDPDGGSEGTQSMTRKDSVESLSQSGYGYGSRHGGSRHSSQYSLNAGIKIESAV